MGGATTGGLPAPSAAAEDGAARLEVAPAVSPQPGDGELGVTVGRDGVVQVGNLEIRPAEYQVLADGRRVGLKVREFQTFVVLAQRPDRVVTRPEIYVVVSARTEGEDAQA